MQFAPGKGKIPGRHLILTPQANSVSRAVLAARSPPSTVKGGILLEIVIYPVELCGVRNRFFTYRRGEDGNFFVATFPETLPDRD